MISKPRFSTPYYVSGRSAQRWHNNQAERGAVTGGVLGASGAALHHPKYRDAALSFAKSKGYHLDSPTHIKAAGKVALTGAGAAGAYAGYHAYEAHKKGKQLNVKAKNKRKK